jgi:hypothetical protein
MSRRKKKKWKIVNTEFMIREKPTKLRKTQ